MSAPLAGKFQDHYALLGLAPKCSSATIQAAYTKAAQKYHPNNPDTGDQTKFDAVNLAFEVLSDPELRKEFDKLKGVDQDDGIPRFSGAGFFVALGRESRLRVALLCLLYDRRRTRPFTPSLSMRQVENSLLCTPEELSFALWYLKQRVLVGQDDKSSLLITVEGMDYLESNQPVPESVMPFIKPAALVPVPAAEPAQPAAPESPASNPAESATATAAPLATLAQALAESSPAAEPAPKELSKEPVPVPKVPESVQSLMRRRARV